MRDLVIETPSWGYADSGTRFATFRQAGWPRDVFERVDDAAEVHRVTGTAGAVALHFPWDAVDDYGGLSRGMRERRALAFVRPVGRRRYSLVLMRPSCTTETTRSPSAVNPSPRARPRAPAATGDSWA